MNQVEAKAVAAALKGQAWHSGGGIWLVRIRRADGRLVVVSDDLVCEYLGEDSFFEGKAESTVSLA